MRPHSDFTSSSRSSTRQQQKRRRSRSATTRGLRTLAWQTDAGTTITETEALNLYERGWRHLDQETLTDHEKAFIQHLADTYSNGRLLV